ncbi:MAG TPA: hypothetical protein VD837_17460 [Terriglobales bacterium]|nr:hypothetical protein [Terriglobales bacterium]
MRSSSTSFIVSSLVLAALFAALCGTASAQAPAGPQTHAGVVEGTRYISHFFGFSFSLPEQWAVRSVAGKTVGSGHMLLSLKPKDSGGGLATMMLTAAPLPDGTPNGVNDNLWRYLLGRYRLNQGPESDTTINGIPTSRLKKLAGVPDPVLLTFGERSFYRLRVDNSGVSRLAIATVEKGHAIVFESLVPQNMADRTEAELIDSLHSLSFGAPAPVRSETRTDIKPN